MQPPQRPLHIEIGRTVGSYVVGQAKVAGILSLLYMLGFALAGLPWWPLIGLICGLLNLIPIFGAVVALVLAGYVSLFSDREWTWVYVLVAFVVVQALEGFVITPRILGRSLGMPPLLVFVAVLVGGLFFNIVGVLLAVPIAAIGYLLWKRRRQLPSTR
jgi:predicted PurR-regulated permease PerM